jgi:hypothetical protein
MEKPCDVNSSIIGLRFNSITVDYKPTPEISPLSRTIKIDSCAVRMDTYNGLSFVLFFFPAIFDVVDRTKSIEHRTFDSSMLSNGISRFVSKVRSENFSHIRVLSNFDGETNSKTYKLFAEFAKYYCK